MRASPSFAFSFIGVRLLSFSACAASIYLVSRSYKSLTHTTKDTAFYFLPTFYPLLVNLAPSERAVLNLLMHPQFPSNELL